MGLPILLEEICRPILAHRHMNVEIGAKAALLPEKEYISGISLAVQIVDPGALQSVILFKEGRCQ
jgi:hypothetical protein